MGEILVRQFMQQGDVKLDSVAEYKAASWRIVPYETPRCKRIFTGYYEVVQDQLDLCFMYLRIRVTTSIKNLYVPKRRRLDPLRFGPMNQKVDQTWASREEILLEDMSFWKRVLSGIQTQEAATDKVVQANNDD